VPTLGMTHLSHISEPDLRVFLAIDVGLVVNHAHQIPEKDCSLQIM
jgi:hypothetical protein